MIEELLSRFFNESDLYANYHEHLTRNQVAEMGNTSHCTVNNWMRIGLLNPFKFDGVVRYAKTNVVQLLRQIQRRIRA